MAAVEKPVSFDAHGVSPAHLAAIPKQKAQHINILLTSFAGLGLPRTLALPIAASTPISDVVKTILARLPTFDHPLVITTTSNKQLLASDTAPVSSLLSDNTDSFLPCRLSARLCGGKGGFGSQLRAAGGRMSSRKNRNGQQANPNGSNRNLDGRRLRTVDEAKRLADYLAIKPEMEKREKEERKQRWEAVVAAAEKREGEIKSGKSGANQGRLDAEYVEGKEMAEEKTREAVLKAMREGNMELERTGSESSAADEEESDDAEMGGESSGSDEQGQVSKQGASGPTFFGWDEDDDDEEDDLQPEAGSGAAPQPASLSAQFAGKGKGRAT
ncbi:hypothetical protein BAUCODRAFT_122803 [Baudoinia panamericana UAMH 10762]|uniref:Uncharacterized protein n=1 Tax=Baudoinia panamericana (strain UAMH 10762) TaxID=717646 RepID=M2ND47_BAUPA|nr:uncharacterized protein BAUCODRAFT_122803 [Baudoinia panamericana UAMH 10762]EMC96845.1 hypothetical protein BAUCODRAFT_122803 [Baudoinia panamericana UAMH 10762]